MNDIKNLSIDVHVDYLGLLKSFHAKLDFSPFLNGHNLKDFENKFKATHENLLLIIWLLGFHLFLVRSLGFGLLDI